MVSAQIQKSIDVYIEGWNTLNAEELIKVVNDEVDFHDLMVDQKLSTKSEVKQFHEGLFASISNPKMEVVNVSGNETDFAATEWRVSFNYTKTSPMLPMPAQGQEIKMLGVALCWFDTDGKLTKHRVYGKFLM